MAPLTKRCNCTSHGCNGQEIGYNQYRQHQKEDKQIQEVEKEACDLKKKPRAEEHIVSLILGQEMGQESVTYKRLKAGGHRSR